MGHRSMRGIHQAVLDPKLLRFSVFRMDRERDRLFIFYKITLSNIQYWKIKRSFICSNLHNSGKETVVPKKNVSWLDKALEKRLAALARWLFCQNYRFFVAYQNSQMRNGSLPD